MTPREIRIEDFDYPLPPHRIARHPLDRRDACRLLVADSDYDSAPRSLLFSDLPGLLPDNALLVRNNTRVIPARLRMHKPTGGAIEIFLLNPAQPTDYVRIFETLGQCEWMCMVGNLKKWHFGPVSLEGEGILLEAEKIAPPDAEGLVRVRLSWHPADMDFASMLEKAGRIPIPPYLERDTELSDITDYQTVYSMIRGSVAAPTAGLHFTPALFDSLAAHGISTADVTLHVGAGTFKPVKSPTMEGHAMHTERFSISLSLLDSLIEALSDSRPVIAVGTTSVRTLESLPLLALRLINGESPAVTQWEAYDRDDINSTDTITMLKSLRQYIVEHNDGRDLDAATSLMIAPGFRWRIVSGMVTNFHQPKSTLLLLVSAFLERHGGNGNRWRKLYDFALADPEYRFLSYGDACLLLSKW